jgi:hypothetical protein
MDAGPRRRKQGAARAGLQSIEQKATEATKGTETNDSLFPWFPSVQSPLVAAHRRKPILTCTCSSRSGSKPVIFQPEGSPSIVKIAS